MPAAGNQRLARPAVAGLLAKDNISLPVTSSVPSRSRGELLDNWSVPPSRRAGRRHGQNHYDR